MDHIMIFTVMKLTTFACIPLESVKYIVIVYVRKGLHVNIIDRRVLIKI
jgi:hypothetical protein